MAKLICHMMIKQYIAAFIGAGLGACLRLCLSTLNGCFRHTITWLPLGTLISNVLGGLLAAVVLGVLQDVKLSETVKVFIMTGLLGGLTTFSTFSVEVFSLLLSHKWLYGLGLVMIHVALTLLAVALGFMVARTYIHL
ncbi:CrcB family protein [Moraxella nasovis]|uniref:fluoride efflux transporter FluC n=1 Tax=Moraxella nasovis TaxID=2904121 RepID=UPI001F6099E5|nr:CrcB family protein [Moraxella nasovis]UNU73855.1 CrcB family protein [Moraxella nasovis]